MNPKETPQAVDRKVTTSFTIPRRTFDFLEAVSRERFEYNRSRALEHYIELGRDAEAEGWRPKTPKEG